VTFALLGGQATLLTGVGRHSSADYLRADLQRTGVRPIDAAEADESRPASFYPQFIQGGSAGDRGAG
jgi:sugar/nucleoside kinase (ribokinase family)